MVKMDKKNWRPKNLENPYRKVTTEAWVVVDGKPPAVMAVNKEYRVFEEGVDATLEALKKGGEYVENSPTYPRPRVTVVDNGTISEDSLILARSIKRGEKGYLVFIPEEVGNNVP
jgi:hypothetical protein